MRAGSFAFYHDYTMNTNYICYTAVMHIYMAADHNGFKLKNELKDWLKEQGHTVSDFGPEVYDKTDDYPDYGIKVARAVAEDPSSRCGIVLCGTGVGMAVVADKVKGVRAALIHDPAIAEAARRDDNTNVLALGASFITFGQAKQVVRAWLASTFLGAERHQRRIGKIQQYEQEHS